MAIASENEWYKAAYYGGSPFNADGDGYWLYPTQSNYISTDDANYANSVGTVTDVGTYSSEDSSEDSYYGTFDQGGNVWEWNDAIVSTSDRGLRGGSFSSNGLYLRSSDRGLSNPSTETNFIGFRVSSLTPIPEPSAYAAILGMLGLTLALTRRKGRRTL